MLALTFQVGPHRLALDIRRVREVVPHVPLQPLAGAPPWLAGALIYRGAIVPVVDLFRLTGWGDCPSHLSSRILLVPQQGRLTGLLAARVDDLREVTPPETPFCLGASNGPDLGPALADDAGVLHLLEPDLLLPDAFRRQLAAVAHEVPA
jgi:chemotaxis-related protein WspB